MKRTIIEIVVVLLFIGYVVMTMPKPVNLSKVDELQKQCDSLEVLIVKNKEQISIRGDKGRKGFDNEDTEVDIGERRGSLSKF